MSSWSPYLAEFHRDRPGITEDILGVSLDDRRMTPYGWLAAAIPSVGRVVDLACGSAPIWPWVAGHRYVGVDVSAAELARARDRGAGPLVRASATALPLRSGSAEVVVCSMALMIITPLSEVLAEIRRVTADGGRLIAMMPGRGGLSRTDVAAVAGLVAALGCRLTYPNDGQISAPVLAAAGLRMVADQTCQFAYRLGDHADADRFLDSLYLPGLRPVRYRTARAYLRSLAKRVELPVPIRRIQAVADPGLAGPGLERGVAR